MTIRAISGWWKQHQNVRSVSSPKDIRCPPGICDMLPASGYLAMTAKSVFNRNVSRRRPPLDIQSDSFTVADGQEIIPYTVWGNEVKVVIRVDTELKYCGITTKDKPFEIAKTTWINYIFEDEQGKNFFPLNLPDLTPSLRGYIVPKCIDGQTSSALTRNKTHPSYSR